MAPTAEKGTASKMSMVLAVDFVFRYSSRKIRKIVSGRTTFSRSRTRSMASYWPLQASVYPGGSCTFAATTRLASAT